MATPGVTVHIYHHAGWQHKCPGVRTSYITATVVSQMILFQAPQRDPTDGPLRAAGSPQCFSPVTNPTLNYTFVRLDVCVCVFEKKVCFCVGVLSLIESVCVCVCVCVCVSLCVCVGGWVCFMCIYVHMCLNESV